MKYNIRKFLAQNSTVDIILADHTVNKVVQPVLIKTVLPQTFDDIYDRLYSARELIHPAIQPIIDFGSCGISINKKNYLTCKYYPGITLSQLFQKMTQCKKNLPLPVILHIMNSLCDALDYLHNEKEDNYIPHGNICPDNIFITFDGDILLTDTGIADMVTHRFDGITIISNQHTIFTHKDIIKGKEWKKHHEIHSMGLLLLCMLIGYNHFIGFYDQNNTQKLESPSRFFPSIPEDLSTIIAKSIGNKPMFRNTKYSSIHEINSDLIKFSCSQRIRFNKNITAITIYALFSDSKEIPTQLRYLLQESIIDYCKNGNDNAIKMLLNIDNIAPEPQQQKTCYLTNKVTDKELSVKTSKNLNSNSITAPQLSVPYDLHLPSPETFSSNKSTTLPNNLPEETHGKVSAHAIQAFSSIILDKSPELNNIVQSNTNTYQKSCSSSLKKPELFINQTQFPSIRTNSSNEYKDTCPFSKILLKENTHI